MLTVSNNKVVCCLSGKWHRNQRLTLAPQAHRENQLDANAHHGGQQVTLRGQTVTPGADMLQTL